MKTEQEIKERLAYVKGYRDAMSNYECHDCEPLVLREGKIKALEWVLENSNLNCEVKNDNK